MTLLDLIKSWQTPTTVLTVIKDLADLAAYTLIINEKLNSGTFLT